MTERSIFLDALELTDPEQRREYLDQACGVDQELRRQVEELLVSHNDASSFLEKPPEGLVGTIAARTDETVGESLGGDSLEFLNPTDKPGCLGTLSQYEVVEVVGRGGMGIVLRAYDTKLNRVVAIKVLAPELAANAMAVKRFLREARAAAAVSHDHVVTIHAIEEDNRPPFIVMEFVDGQSLQEKIERDGALELNEILRIGMQMASGLEAAHEQGLVHRDIKPANILLENGVERVKLTDFGLARAVDDVSVTQTGQIAGTPQFMSPEQALGQTIDARSDLFSLGSVLYTMCTGRPPFRADSAVAMLRRVTDDDPRSICEVNSDIPDWLEAIIFKLLAKDPEERFQAAAEVAELLGQHLAHLQHPTTAPPQLVVPAKVGRASRPVQDGFGNPFNRKPIIAAGLAIIASLALATIASVVIYIKTDYGMIRVEVNDPNTTVTIDDEQGLSFQNSNNRGSLSVRAGEHTLHIKQGDLEFDTDRFRVKRGEEVVLSVELIDGRLGARLKPTDRVIGLRREGVASQRFAIETSDGTYWRFGGENQPVATDGKLPRELETFVLEWQNVERTSAYVQTPGGFYLRGVLDRDRRLRAMDERGSSELFECEWLNRQERSFRLRTRDGVYVSTDADGASLTTSRNREKRETFTLIAVPGRPLSEQELQELAPDEGWFDLLSIAEVDKDETGAEWRREGNHLALIRGELAGLRFLVDPGANYELRSRFYRRENGGAVKFWLPVPGGHACLSFNDWDEYHGLQHFDGKLLHERESGPALAKGEQFVLNERHEMTARVRQNGDHVRITVTLDGQEKFDWSGPAATVIHPKFNSPHGIGLGCGLTPGIVWESLRIYAVPDNEAFPEPARHEQLTEVCSFEGSLQAVTGLVWLPDMQRVAAASGQTLRVWKTESGEQLMHLIDKLPQGSPAVDAEGRMLGISSAFSLGVSANGRLAATGHYNGVVCVWDLVAGRQVRRFSAHWSGDQHKSAVYEVVFTPEGKQLMTAGTDGSVRFWDLSSGELAEEYDYNEERIRAAALSPDGRLVLAGTFQNSLTLTDRDTGKTVRQFPHRGAVLSVRFSPDGRLAITGEGNGDDRGKPDRLRAVRVWDVSTGKMLHEWKAHTMPVECVDFSPDGRFIVSGSMDRTIRIWDAASGEVVAQVATRTHVTNRVAFSPDGRSLISAAGQFWDKETNKMQADGDFAVRLWMLPERIWPIEKLTEVRAFEGHSDMIGALDFVPDGKSLVSGSQKVLYQWDLATGTVVREIPFDSPVKGLAALPDSRHVITSHKDGNITMWDLTDGQSVRSFTGHTDEVHQIAVSGDGQRLLSGGSGGLVRLWDVATGKPIRSFQVPDCTAVAISHDGRLAVHGGTSLVVWNVESGDMLQTLKRQSGSVNAVAFSPDGRFVLSGDYHGIIEIWQVATGRQMGRLNAHNAAIKSLVFFPNGRYFASGSFDQTILLFDRVSSQFIARAKSDDHSTTFLAMAPDGQSMASGGGYWLKPKENSPWEFAVHTDREFPIRHWRMPDSVVQSETMTNSLGMNLRLISAGEFEMGTADEDVAVLPADDNWFFAGFVPDRRRAETPRHKVTISKPFEMSAHEVTVDQFRKFIETSGYQTTAEQDGEGYGWRNGEWQRGPAFDWKNPGFEQTGDRPVCNVSWEDAVAFCRWLSEKEGITYRLPTEAEWEYACRAGTTTRFWTGDDVNGLTRAANLADQSLRKQQPSVTWAVNWDDGFPATAAVGSFRPNPFGLHDMHGNAWEWCQDVYDDQWYEASPATDPLRRGSGRHVFRGGGFDNWPGFLRSADRYSSHSPTIHTEWGGFRVVRESAAQKP